MKHINIALFVVHKGCPHTCSFCNQRSISGFTRDLTSEDIHSAVKTAMESTDKKKLALGEIAFFGGSFTMIDREYMLKLLETAYSYVKKGVCSGIRISTRPDGINEEICEILKNYGVTAVELGAQSLDDRVLALNERGHDSKQVIEASKMLKKYGFELGFQMMTGLYGSEDEDSLESARKIIEIHPDTVRIYPTVVLKGTKLCELMEQGEFMPKGVEETVELCARLIPMFENEGINVIRVGLHSGGGVEEEFVGGAYHPALRELCEGRIFRNTALRELEKLDKGSYILEVARGQISKMTGQNKSNINYFSELGYKCRVVQADELKKFEVKVRKTDDTEIN